MCRAKQTTYGCGHSITALQGCIHGGTTPNASRCPRGRFIYEHRQRLCPRCAAHRHFQFKFVIRRPFLAMDIFKLTNGNSNSIIGILFLGRNTPSLSR